MAVNSFNAQNPPVTTKGDVFTFSTIPTRLGVGANDTVLTADSSTATGLKWAAAGSSLNWTLLNSGGTALTGAATITVSSISGKDNILILVDQASSANIAARIAVRLNADSGTNYRQHGMRLDNSLGNNATNLSTYNSGTNTKIDLGIMSLNAGSTVSGYVMLSGANSSGNKAFTALGAATASGSTDNSALVTGGVYTGSSTISSISINSDSGNLDGGTVYVYTA